MTNERNEEVSRHLTRFQELKRHGEHGTIPPRRKRIFTDGKNWYFLSRHHDRHGPFDTFTDAKAALRLFLRRSGVIKFSDDPNRL